MIMTKIIYMLATLCIILCQRCDCQKLSFYTSMTLQGDYFISLVKWLLTLLWSRTLSSTWGPSPLAFFSWRSPSSPSGLPLPSSRGRFWPAEYTINNGHVKEEVMQFLECELSLHFMFLSCRHLSMHSFPLYVMSTVNIDSGKCMILLWQTLWTF